MKGQLTPLEMVRAMSKRPAEILGIERGTLMQGAVADITIFFFCFFYQLHAACSTHVGNVNTTARQFGQH